MFYFGRHLILSWVISLNVSITFLVNWAKIAYLLRPPDPQPSTLNLIYLLSPLTLQVIWGLRKLELHFEITIISLIVSRFYIGVPLSRESTILVVISGFATPRFVRLDDNMCAGHLVQLWEFEIFWLRV